MSEILFSVFFAELFPLNFVYVDQGPLFPPSLRTTVKIFDYFKFRLFDFSGCYGLFCTVSSYKEHCDKCEFRTKHPESEKKPLLGFARRNSKGSLDVSQADGSGPSFEIVEGYQVKPCEGSDMVKVEPVPDFAPQDAPEAASKRSHSTKSQKSRKSTDESMLETIDSVIRKYCYGEAASNDTAENDASVAQAENVKVEPSPSGQDRNGEPVKKVRSKAKRKSPVDAQTRDRNMKTVQLELVRELVGAKSKKPPRKVLVLSEKVKVESEPAKDEPAAQKVKKSRRPRASSDPGDARKRRQRKNSRGYKAMFYEYVAKLNVETPSAEALENVERTKPESSDVKPTKSEVKQTKFGTAEAKQTKSGTSEVKQSKAETSDVKRTRETEVRGKSKAKKKKVPHKRRSEGELLTEQFGEILGSRFRKRTLVGPPAKRVLRSKTRTDVDQETTRTQGVEDVGEDEVPSDTKEEESAEEPSSPSAKLKRSKPSETKEQESAEEPSSSSAKPKKSKPCETNEEGPAEESPSPHAKPKKSKSSESKEEESADDPVSSSAKPKKKSAEDAVAASVGSAEGAAESPTKRRSAFGDLAKESKPKTKVSRRKAETDVSPKKTENSNSDLGFTITKTCKTVQRGSKTRCSTVEGETVPVKIENDESKEANVNFSTDSSAQNSGQTGSCAAVSSQENAPCAPQSNERIDFLAEVPSIPPPNSLTPMFGRDGYTDEYSFYGEEESMVSNFVTNVENEKYDGVCEKYAKKSQETMGSERPQELVPSENWYSDVMDFLQEERSFKSIGSIINSVNEVRIF